MQTKERVIDRLNKYLAMNLGQAPLKAPQGQEEIKLFRICINILRQAEEDYLSGKTPQKTRAVASQTLFGLHTSLFPVTCRLLGIDPVAARLKIIEWKMLGKEGDPVFSFLHKEDVVKKYEMGKIRSFVSL